MSVYVTLQGNINVLGCYTCQALIAFTEIQEKRLRESHRTFYCPEGHPQRFAGETEKDRTARLQWERLEGLVAQERRLREEAERRTGEAEKKALAAKREMLSTKRVLRNTAKMGAKLAKEKHRSRKAKTQ